MDGKIKTLNILLVIHICIGVLITPYATFATYVMGGAGIAIPVFIFGSSVLIYFPYYAKKCIAIDKFTPCIVHAILVILGTWLLLPLGIWQLYLAVTLKNNLVPKNA